MNVIQLFVGLNSDIVTDCPPAAIERLLIRWLEQRFDAYTIQRAEGCWKGQREPVAIVTLVGEDTEPKAYIDREIATLSAITGQECILVIDGGQGRLVNAQ